MAGICASCTALACCVPKSDTQQDLFMHVLLCVRWLWRTHACTLDAGLLATRRRRHSSRGSLSVVHAATSALTRAKWDLSDLSLPQAAPCAGQRGQHGLRDGCGGRPNGWQCRKHRLRSGRRRGAWALQQAGHLLLLVLQDAGDVAKEGCAVLQRHVQTQKSQLASRHI